MLAVLTVTGVLCFSARDVLKPTFHNCRGFAMLVDSCFSAGKIRQSPFHSCGGSVEVVQLSFGTKNVVK